MNTIQQIQIEHRKYNNYLTQLEQLHLKKERLQKTNIIDKIELTYFKVYSDIINKDPLIYLNYILDDILKWDSKYLFKLNNINTMTDTHYKQKLILVYYELNNIDLTNFYKFITVNKLDTIRFL